MPTIHVDRATTPDGRAPSMAPENGCNNLLRLVQPAPHRGACGSAARRRAPASRANTLPRPGAPIQRPRLVADFGELLGDPACALGLTLAVPGSPLLVGIEPIAC